MRPLLVAPLAALLSLSVALAAVTDGTVRAVDARKKTITLAIDGKDKTFPVGADAPVVTVTRVPGKKGAEAEKATPLAGGLGALQPGTKVTVLTEAVNGRDVVASVRVSGPAPERKKKKAP